MYRIFLYYYLVVSYSNYFGVLGTSNSSAVTSKSNNELDHNEEFMGIWGPMLEEWTTGSRRESRVMQIPIGGGAYLVKDRIDHAPSTEPIKKETKISPGKIVNNNYPNNNNNYYNTPMKKPQPNSREISETDLYLLGAIEKLVYKVDFMEKRLRKVEEMMYYVMAGNRIDTDPCKDNFTRVGKLCYYFASEAGREYDWKVANKHCKKLGATLAELETIEENQDMIAYIQSNTHLRGKDYWTGGLNPGLLWIWSNSARPVANNTSTQNAASSTHIYGEGRCLRLAYNPGLRSYSYKGSDCGTRFSYICEAPENSSSNELRKIGRKLRIFDEL